METNYQAGITRIWCWINKCLAWPLIVLLRIYQLAISPLMGPHCRFEPSCSRYSELAIRRHGVFKGSALTVQRVCKCHPWHEGGCDPVPDKTNSNS